MRIWFKSWKQNHMLRDFVVEDYSEETRTHKIFNAVEKACYEFDVSKPIWLDSTVREFKKHGKARFTKDNFIDEIDFDYLEIHVLDED